MTFVCPVCDEDIEVRLTGVFGALSPAQKDVVDAAYDRHEREHLA